MPAARPRTRTRRLRATLGLTGLALATSAVLAPLASAQQGGGSEPAGGAATGELVIATIVALVLTAGGLVFAWAYRQGRVPALDGLARFSGRVSGLPGWVALPSAIAGGALVIAVFGFYWDVATHIDNGRDAGPFANPSHYFILAGLAGIVLAGFVAVLLGTGRKTPTSVEIREGWHAPLGGLLLLVCGTFAITGFPLDDLWHRLFGQDVTLWGPTHILMIAGASLSTLAIWILLCEGMRARSKSAARPRRADAIFMMVRGASIAGGFLIGLSTLQLEFDFGVPQFALVYQPIMIALAAGVALVAARARLGRGGALMATAFYIGLHALLTLVVGPLFGHTTMHFPLYIAEALLVEGVALVVSRDRPLTLGAVSGALIGTVGVAAEWGWSHVWMPIPWREAMFPEILVLAPVAGIAGGILGGFIGRALMADRVVPEHAPRWLAPVAALAAVAVIAVPLPRGEGDPVRGQVTVTDVRSSSGREGNLAIRLDPPRAAEAAGWFGVLSWQGGGSRVTELEETAPGVYRTTAPVPLDGNWKSLVRLIDDRSMTALPVYLPRDEAIPAPLVPATPTIDRAFVSDTKILQREATGENGGLKLPAYLALLAIAALWLAALTWGVRRMTTHVDPPAPPRPPAAEQSEAQRPRRTIAPEPVAH